MTATASRKIRLKPVESVIVLGRLFISNGVAPVEISWTFDGRAVFNRRPADYHLTVVNGAIIVEYTSGFRGKAFNPDDAFRLTRSILDIAVSEVVARQGVGLTYILEACRTSKGEMLFAKPDRTPTDETFDVESKKLLALLGRDEEVRFAIRDFNSGLTNREDAPFLFYRMVEGLARAVAGASGDSANWDEFHRMIGTTRDEMKTLEKFGGSHRHAVHLEFSGPEHIQMMREARHFLIKALQYLTR